jgi:Prenyltransferase and squalene oxidase repeat
LYYFKTENIAMRQHKNRLIVLFIVTLLSACGNESKETNPRSQAGIMLKKAAAYLWEKQSPDGGWHSEIHGILRGGQAYTPYILLALRNVPDSILHFPEDKWQLGLDYLRKNINADGVLGFAADGVLEYPNYSTSLALRVLLRENADEDQQLREKMANYLASEQYDEDRGFSPDSLAYGGWGFGEVGIDPGYVGQVDLSHTRRVLEALHEYHWSDPKLFDKANKYLSVLQRLPDETRRQPGVAKDDKRRIFFDGGFYYSSTSLMANKGKKGPGDEEYQPYYRSYASATADGLIALLASGATADDLRVQESLRWLSRNPGWERPGGIPPDDPDQWDHVIILYHVCSRAEALRAAGVKGDWVHEMLAFLQTKQSPDGSFHNPEGTRNKEDDPLLGTAFVVNALCQSF